MSGSFHSFYEASGMASSPFWPQGVGDADGRAGRPKAASGLALDAALKDELLAQNQAWPSQARSQNLERLLSGGAAAVITGQQVGLFLGPLYTFYKAATAVALARLLSRESQVPCVPLFWLQTEDHDFAEIAACEVPCESGPPRRLELAGARDGARHSVVERVLGDDVLALLAALEASVEGSSHGPEVLDLFRRHYVPGRSVAAAFAGALAELFGGDGLLLYQPRQAAGARLAAPLIRRALSQSADIEGALERSAQRLRDAGYPLQIPLRSSCPLVFLHPDGPGGPRYRLERVGDRFRIKDGGTGAAELTLEELVEKLEREPLQFSTSALLRPLLQDQLFPTAAYVGGNAEIDYFAQLPDLYSHLGMKPPLLAPRAHFRLVPPRVQRWRTSTLGASTPSGEGLGLPELAWSAELERRLAGYLSEARERAPGMVRGTERTLASVHASMTRLVSRARTAAAERGRVFDVRLAKVDAWMEPGGRPQERVFGVAPFAAQVGWSALGRAVAAAIDPLRPQTKEVVL